MSSPGQKAEPWLAFNINSVQTICLCCLIGNRDSGSIVSSLGDIMAPVFHGLQSKGVEWNYMWQVALPTT